MPFRLTVALGNDALQGEARAPELGRLLRDAAERVERGSGAGVLFDENGNRVGSFELDEHDEEAF